MSAYRIFNDHETLEYGYNSRLGYYYVVYNLDGAVVQESNSEGGMTNDHFISMLELYDAPYSHICAVFIDDTF